MKLNCKTLFFAFAAFAANASTIQFSSNATAVDSTENNSLGNNVVIQKNPAWSNPIGSSSWISFTNTGDPSSKDFISPANGTVVSFYQRFTLTQADLAVNGTVSLYADDSAATILNGTTLLPEASAKGNTYATCSDTKPNCISLTTVTLPSNYLVLGANTLRFDVAQRAGSSFGLDYAGSVGASNLISTTTAPEPATWAFLAGGLLLVSVTARRARLTASN